MKKLVLALLISSMAFAGTNNLPLVSGGTIQTGHINKFQTALSGDHVPRDSSGNVGTNTASLGQTIYHWLRAYISSGYWSLGDIKAHHSYNGTAPIDEGWMLCDGRQVTQANYDSEHGSGHWATYVGSSPLLNLYLPNMTARYPVGVASTTQSGASPITAVGVSGNSLNLAHSHTVNASGLQLAQQYSSGTAVSVVNWPSTDSQLSSPQSIQPDSIQYQYYMRVIQ